MSLLDLQKGLSLLARYPGLEANDLSDLLDELDLTTGERNSLLELAPNRELRKFGDGLLDQRWSLVTARLPLVGKAVPLDALFQIFVSSFEPIASEIANHEVALAFLDFLERDDDVRKYVSEIAADYVWDFIAFEKVQLEIERDRWEGLATPSAASPLKTLALYPRAFRYDLPAYLQALQDSESELPEPLPRETFALLLGEECLPGYRLFELEPETYAFLSSALRGEAAPFPSSYPELVAAGLCKQVSNAAV